MKPSVLMRLGIKHIQNAYFEELYLKTKIDKTRPVAFYAVINQRCNSKCRYCNFWRLEKYLQELTIEEWEKGLLSIKKFVGSYSISFSGGEPFLKKDFISLLTWCRDQSIQAGVTTNGILLANRRFARKVVQTRPFNLNVSIDSNLAEINDWLRGATNSFEMAQKGVRNVLALQKELGIEFPVVLKPTISSKNFRKLPQLVRWATEIGFTSISMQPLFHWTKETYEELWIKEADMEELTRVIETLIKMKGNNFPILNSKSNLRLVIDNFMNKKAPDSLLPCRVGLRNLNIWTNGDVRSCTEFKVIGNLKHQSAKKIWYSDLAKKERARTTSCSKLCLMTCTSQKTIIDKFKIARNLFIKKY